MKRAFSVISALAILIFLASCYSSPLEQNTTLLDRYYRFEPTTLIDSLKSGQTNLFTFSSKKPEFLPRDQQLAVTWLQEDYFSIANSLYSDVLRNSLEGWQLNTMDFASACKNIDKGFQNGRFEFFTVVNDTGNELRITRFIDIDTRGNFVHVKEKEYSPKVEDWDAIDLEKLKISAIDAFLIAERYGGKEKRQVVKNECEVALVLAPDNAHYRGWAVIYTQTDGTSLFYIQIDPYTGEIAFP